MNLDYPCTCGHLAGHHAMEKTNLFKFCIKKNCMCNDFVSDNLRYLELLSEKRDKQISM
jgi:hypothetical protein